MYIPTANEQIDLIYAALGIDDSKLYNGIIDMVIFLNKEGYIITSRENNKIHVIYNGDLFPLGMNQVPDDDWRDYNKTQAMWRVQAVGNHFIGEGYTRKLSIETERINDDYFPKNIVPYNSNISSSVSFTSFDFDKYHKNEYVETEEEYDAFGNKITSKDKSDDSEIEYIDVVAGNNSMNRAGADSGRLTFRGGEIVREDPNSINRAGAYD